MKIIAYCTVLKTIELEVDDKFVQLEEALKAVNEKPLYEISKEEDDFITELQNDLTDHVIAQVDEDFDCTVLNADIWTSDGKMALANDEE